MITSVAFFVYQVSDVARARRFYEETLGLKLESDFRGCWLEYDLNGTTIALAAWGTDRVPGAQGGTLALEVDDLDATVSTLRKKDVRVVQEPFETPVCRMARIADPDNNEIILHQRKA
jgi:predicted enzyme related to lactoylglutathione lyase